MRQRLGLVFALALIAATALSGVAQAAAGDDAVIAANSFSLGFMQSSFVGASCPGGSPALGGGVGTTSNSPQDTLGASAPLDESGLTANTTTGDIARSWGGYVSVSGGSQAGFKIFAICSRSSDATISANSFSLMPGQGMFVGASCPGGSRVVGGGVGTTSSSPYSNLMASGPLDETGSTANTTTGDVARSWGAYVYSGSQADFKIFAICSQSSDATISANSFSLDPGQGMFVGATCPGGSRALGGGVGTTANSPNDNVEASGPLDETGLTANTTTGDIAKSWGAYVFSDQQADFKIFAICEKPSSGPGAGAGRCHGKAATIFATSAKTLGTRGSDVIVGRNGKDKIIAGSGDDLVCAGKGNDTIKGGPGKDKLLGEGGKDRLLGQAGKDVLKGGPGKDSTSGGAGKDVEKP
jgi:Ca2+-binding RTX toxin-like protein